MMRSTFLGKDVALSEGEMTKDLILSFRPVFF
jgi:hypothetical protein